VGKFKAICIERVKQRKVRQKRKEGEKAVKRLKEGGKSGQKAELHVSKAEKE
jgi:hypothetical protein